MFGHLPELIIILALALIVFGPEKLPEAAASAGKMVREMREVMNGALEPHDTEVTEEFSTYYYDSLERAGEDVPEVDEADLSSSFHAINIDEHVDGSSYSGNEEPSNGSHYVPPAD